MNISYNISDNLKTNLSRIEKLRIDILTYPLSPKNELRLRWDSQLEKIIWSLSLTDSSLSKSDVVKLLSSTVSKKKINSYEKDVINQKNAFNYIKENWTVTKAPVDLNVVKKLYDISCKSTLGPMSGLTEYSEKRLKALFDYLGREQDHPVIQAGIVQPEVIAITPFDNGNGRIARLLSYLYLYRGGFDIRGMFNLEEYYKRDVVTYKRMLEMSKIQGNLTVWLEYFSYGMGIGLEKRLDIIKNLKFKEELPASFWKLNPRQQQILETLEFPERKITNKDVQKMHGVSQITASRDLSRLVSLGLLLTNGKGRSVYYTRV
ncbi:MAG: Fic family protein [Candidatus Woesebacteria bacterium]|nr:MAG: Fic family protein [Candidatus Woesebacteria bacterium]